LLKVTQKFESKILYFVGFIGFRYWYI